jgi:heat shock protein HslJ
MRPTLAMLGALALVLTGCAGTTSGSGDSSGPGDTEATNVTDISGEWQLTKASDADGSMSVSGVAVTLAVNGTEVAGQGPCNRYTGTVTVEGDTVTFGPIAQTRMSCGGDRDALDTRYAAALSAVTGSRLGGDILTLSGTDVSLRYTLLPKKSVR